MLEKKRKTMIIITSDKSCHDVWLGTREEEGLETVRDCADVMWNVRCWRR